MTKVENMVSNNGNSVPNQFIITTEKGQYFQSYRSIIAFQPYGGRLQLDEYYWNYSKTTGKYRNMFTGLNSKETEKAIKEGRIELVNLNQK